MFKTHLKPTRYLLLSLAAALAFGFTQCQQQSAQAPTVAAVQPASAAVTAPATPLPSAADLSTAIARVAKENIPAVVHIDVTQGQEVSNPFQPFQNDPFFHFFFNNPHRMPRKFKRELRGLGTGMIMDSEGHILTNNHVVGGADTIQVLLADGRSYKAKVVGTDPKTDLAVIRIKADEQLPHVTFGDSDRMEVGDWVVAIGHPRGLDQTVTQGIISAKHRRGILDPSSYQDYLQTDAAINPGNSGGPLINMAGQVIGVNAAIVSQSGGFEGIGFAIPSNMAVHIAQELIKNGKVERGWLGVSIKDLGPQEVKKLNLENNKGALVVEVVKDSPAGEAGLRKDDVVKAYDGKQVVDAATLQNAVANTAIGAQVPITLLRDGKNVELKVKIGNLQTAVEKLAAAVEDRLGARVRPVTAKEAQKDGLDESKGVAIASLKSDSPLAKAGFEVNDIILAVNGQDVSGVQDFISLIKALPHDHPASFLAVDHRTGQSGYVDVTVD
jgi:serine protease Do